MIVLGLIALILLIAIFAIGFTVGGRLGNLPPASNRSVSPRRRSSRAFTSATTKSGQTNSAKLIQSETRGANSSVSHTSALDVSAKQTKITPVFSPATNNKSVVITPNNKRITIKPSSVIQVEPTISPRQTVVVKPQEPIVIRPQETVVVKPSLITTVMVEPSQATTVEPPKRGAWDERGWTKNTNRGRETYEGYYRVGARQFQGRIEVKNRGRDVSAYIYNPPREIKRHKHHACFQQVGNGWFFLHWARPARNVDDAILYIERVLDESLNK